MDFGVTRMHDLNADLHRERKRSLFIFFITSRSVNQFKWKFQTIYLKECSIYVSENVFSLIIIC